jgi:hypothetical protein
MSAHRLPLHLQQPAPPMPTAAKAAAHHLTLLPTAVSTSFYGQRWLPPSSPDTPTPNLAPPPDVVAVPSIAASCRPPCSATAARHRVTPSSSQPLSGIMSHPCAPLPAPPSPSVLRSTSGGRPGRVQGSRPTCIRLPKTPGENNLGFMVREEPVSSVGPKRLVFRLRRREAEGILCSYGHGVRSKGADR